METVDKAASSAHQAVDSIASATNQAAETLSEKGRQLRSAEQQLMESLRVYINDNPVTAMGIGVVTGFLLSRMTGCRCPHKHHES
ncbi:MAG: DUF883 domain-containing protein [Methylobacter sp.]